MSNRRDMPSPFSGRRWAIGFVAVAGALLPSCAAHAAPRHALTGYVVFYDNGASARDWMRTANAWESVTFDAGSITPSAGVEVQVPAWAISFVRTHRIRAQLCVSNYGTSDFDAGELDAILRSATLTRTLETNLVSAVRHGPYSGLNVDFELNPPKDASRFVGFLSALRQRLHAIGKTLTVDLPARTPSDTWDGGYDFAAIGSAVDRVDLMAYDYSYPGGPAGPLAPVPWVESALRYAVAYIPVDKILLGIPAYGYDWYGTQTGQLTLPQTDQELGRLHIVPRWDQVSSSPWYAYTDPRGARHEVHYENARSLAPLLRLAQRYDVHGVSLWYIGSEDKGFWPPLLRYAAGRTP